jgi:energy-coupling factor transporter transmembrane protein EcfT
MNKFITIILYIIIFVGSLKINFIALISLFLIFVGYSLSKKPFSSNLKYIFLLFVGIVFNANLNYNQYFYVCNSPNKSNSGYIFNELLDNFAYENIKLPNDIKVNENQNDPLDRSWPGIKNDEGEIEQSGTNYKFTFFTKEDDADFPTITLNKSGQILWVYKGSGNLPMTKKQLMYKYQEWFIRIRDDIYEVQPKPGIDLQILYNLLNWLKYK